jgi:hypothetical protein
MNNKEIKPKTARQLLTESKDLPFWIRRRALNNIENQIPEYLELQCSNLWYAVVMAFVWENTAEGSVFWNMVIYHLEEGKPLPTAKDLIKPK